MTIITTNRLIIRKLNTDDAPFILKLLNDPSFIENIGDKKVRSIADAEDYIKNGPMASYDKNGFGLFLTILKQDEHCKPIGICGLIKRPELEEVDIGFAYLPEFSGLGFGYESSKAVLDYAESTIGLKRVAAIVTPENKASIGLLEKLGLRFEKKIQMQPDEPKIDYYGISYSS